MRTTVAIALLRLCLAGIVGAVVVASVANLLRRPRDVHAFSLRKSPDGAFVAESASIGNGEAGGLLIIRAKDGSEKEVDFGTPSPGMFLRWTDNRHLELWNARQPADLRQIDRIGEVSLIAKTYTLPRTLQYNGPGAKKIVVPTDKVTETFARHQTEDGRICVLTLRARQDPTFDAASVDVTAHVTATCRRPHPCLGISTRFTLSSASDGARQRMLTSATISDIPSYNRLPDGSDGTSVRGQFLGRYTVALVNEIAKPSISLDFSRDFFDQIIRYELPLAGNSAADFRQCVGDAQPL